MCCVRSVCEEVVLKIVGKELELRRKHGLISLASRIDVGRTSVASFSQHIHIHLNT